MTPPPPTISYRDLIERAPEAIVFIDVASGKFVEANESACRILGRERANVIGIGPADISPEKQPDGRTSVESVRRRLVEVLDERCPCFEWTHSLPNGAEFVGEVRLALVPGSERRLIRATVVDISDRKRIERNGKDRRAVLEGIAKGHPLSEILASIVALVDSEMPNALGSLLVHDADRGILLHGAAPRLPEFYNQAIHGVKVGPNVGSCGAAAYLGRRVVVADIDVHPNWEPYRELARRAGVRSCWSEPIVASTGDVLGTFAIYHREPMTPDRSSLDFIADAAHLASIALERSRAEEERRRLEARLRNTQKLESLGVLAGGIAHDFNNLLTAILGYVDLALTELDPKAPTAELLREAERGAQRAAELTNQMLAYSGKGRFVVEPVDVTSLIEDISLLLSITISKKTELRFDLDRRVPAVDADAAQLRQIVMNLIINAAEAIGDEPGTIRISTGSKWCHPEDLAGSAFGETLPAGEFVFIEVADDGCGMSEETRARIFDPFFTTKFTGRGLGLSAVLGIVRGHSGALKVTSEQGKGSSFRIYLPASKQTATPALTPIGNPVSWRGSGAVLVVDDEEVVRTLACRMLATLGFSTQTASNGREGIEVFKREGGRFRFVLLDLTMPELDGVETFRELQAIRSDVPVILSSGYSEQSVSGRFDAAAPAAFVEKPYRLEQLAAAIRSVLS